MKIQVEFREKKVEIDLSIFHDISIPIQNGDHNPEAWYVPPVRIEPVKMGDWVGEVNAGAAVNFRNIFFNPHGHGTHTECVGHISKEDYFINQTLKKHFCFGKVVSIEPEVLANGDRVIGLTQIQNKFPEPGIEAYVIRTIPNQEGKKRRRYSNSNPPYLYHEAARYLKEKGILHLMVDLPSVDKEKDDGKLLAHHAFWNYPQAPRTEATISEMIFVPDSVADGEYFMNIQIAPFQNDASPSKILLFDLTA